jgi:hypothetical protein
VDGTAGLRGHRHVEEALLNDVDRLGAADPSGMLRALASAGAQVRESAALAAEANLAALADEGRPRAVVVAGVGTAARTGDLLETVAGPRCPVPVVGHRSAGIPGWVGAADAVIAVSASGRSPEALAAAEAAGRRGARLVAIGPPDSELQSLAERARAPFVPVPRRAPARASLWALTVPVLLAARTLGLVGSRRPTSPRPRPGSTMTPNAAGPAPTRSSTRPRRSRWTWPTRFRSCGDPHHWRRWRPAGRRHALRQLPLPGRRGLTGRGGPGPGRPDRRHLRRAGRVRTGHLRRPGEESELTRLRLLVLRDGGLADEDATQGEPSAVEERRADAVVELAARRGVRCGVIQAEGASPLERLASLIAVPDFASVYLALAHGLDPTAVPAVDEMKEFTRR